MQARLVVLAVVLQAGFALPASAGLFNKSAKPAAAPNCQDVIAVLKSDPDEHKRQAAAEQLRHFDTKTSPDVIPALMDALQRDASVSVRVEAAQSLGKLRPISQDAGVALQLAAVNDPSLRVRMQARTSLIHYQLCGYHTAKIEGPQVNAPSSKEPPLASSSGTAPVPTPNRITPLPQSTAPAMPSLRTPPPYGEPGPVLNMPK